MAGGFCYSATNIATTQSPHPVSVLCLLITLLISPISAVAGRQPNDIAGSPPRVVKTDPPLECFMDLSKSRPPPRYVEEHHHMHARRRPWDEQEKLLSKKEGGSLQSVLVEGAVERQGNCQYEVSIRTSCASLPLMAKQQHRIQISFGDAENSMVDADPKFRSRTTFTPCSVETFTTDGKCLGRVCQVRLAYEGQDGEWTPNYVKVFSGGSMETFCVGSPISSRGNTINLCKHDRATGSAVAALPVATSTAPASTDDEYSSSDFAAAAAEAADIRR